MSVGDHELGLYRRPGGGACDHGPAPVGSQQLFFKLCATQQGCQPHLCPAGDEDAGRLLETLEMEFLIRLGTVAKFQRDRFVFHAQLFKDLAVLLSGLREAGCLGQDHDPCIFSTGPFDKFFKDPGLFNVQCTADCHESCHCATC